MKKNLFVGTTSYGVDVYPFSNIKAFGACESTYPPTCTALLLDELDQNAQQSKMYYITIRVNNTVGLVTRASSKPFRHDVLASSSGIVIDVDSSCSKVVRTFVFNLHLHDCYYNQTNLTLGLMRVIIIPPKIPVSAFTKKKKEKKKNTFVYA